MGRTTTTGITGRRTNVRRGDTPGAEVAAVVSAGVVAGLASSATALDPFLVTVDVQADELVRVDPRTGATTTIGPVGFDASEVDLAWHDGRLLGLSMVTGVSVDLLEFDWQTGAVLWSVPVASDGSALTTGEGLASTDGRLFAAVRIAGPPAASGWLAELSLDGSVLIAFDLSTPIAQADVDGLGPGYQPGMVISVDTVNGSDEIVVYDVDVAVGELAEVGRFTRPESMRAIHDLTIDVDESLVAIDAVESTLHRLDPDTGQLIDSVALVPAGEYRGVALVTPDAGGGSGDGPGGDDGGAGGDGGSGGDDGDPSGDPGGDGVGDPGGDDPGGGGSGDGSSGGGGAEGPGSGDGDGPGGDDGGGEPPATPCPADVDGDGFVTMLDLLIVLASFGEPVDGGSSDPDVTGDGVVDIADIVAVARSFGRCDGGSQPPWAGGPGSPWSAAERARDGDRAAESDRADRADRRDRRERRRSAWRGDDERGDRGRRGRGDRRRR